MGQPEVAVQPKEKRINNFNEVSLGYPKKIALEEAIRCPQCANPTCMKGCPIGINIPGFIRSLREGNVTAAYEKIREQSSLPSICGRICMAPCEIACVLTEEHAPIGIRALERYTSDYGRGRAKRDKPSRLGKKIAIVGSGPAGLSAAYDLVRKGFQVTIYESLDKPGGVLRYGIPEFRIPKKILDQDIADLEAMGVEIKTNFFIGQTASLEDLMAQGYNALLLATGAGIPKFMDLPGANLGRVYYGEEFLMRLNLMRRNQLSRKLANFVIGQRVAVIGSGNTALDCARACRRLGKDVTLVFRRTEEEMFIRRDDRDLTKMEGIVFEPLVKPLAILADQKNRAAGLKCQRMDYADTDQTGKWDLHPLPDSEFVLEVDTVIIGVGHQPNSLLNKFSPQLKLNSDGTFFVNEEGMTSIVGVFACGNIVTNAGPLVEAMASGKRIAVSMEKYLRN